MNYFTSRYQLKFKVGFKEIWQESLKEAEGKKVKKSNEKGFIQGKRKMYF